MIIQINHSNIIFIFSEILPLRDIAVCKKINSVYYSKEYHYFELICNQRQVYRCITESACNDWIETINKAVLYAKFFWNLMQIKNNEVSKYFSKMKDEDVTIVEFENSSDEKLRLKVQPTKQKHKESDCETIIDMRKKDTNQKVEEKKDGTGKKVRPKNPHYVESKKYFILAKEEQLIADTNVNFESFEILNTLGAGTFGKVFKVRHKQTKQIFAMKVINKKQLIKNQQLRYAVTECNVLKQIDHPFIIKLHYSFQTPDYLYMVLDYCPGGDLAFYVMKDVFEEDEAKFFIAELVLAIEKLHSCNIIYRDLKPENILIDVEGHIKLADFGLAKEGIADNKVTTSFCGSPAYLSPEMVNRRGAGKSADIYGIGAVLYEMVYGSPPFYANDLNTMYEKISKQRLFIPNSFSDPLKSLVKVSFFLI